MTHEETYTLVSDFFISLAFKGTTRIFQRAAQFLDLIENTTVVWQEP